MATKKEIDAWTARQRAFRTELKRLADAGDKEGLIAHASKLDEMCADTIRLFGIDDA